jgi:hypothetical protein
MGEVRDTLLRGMGDSIVLLEGSQASLAPPDKRSVKVKMSEWSL